MGASLYAALALETPSTPLRQEAPHFNLLRMAEKKNHSVKHGLVKSVILYARILVLCQERQVAQV